MPRVRADNPRPQQGLGFQAPGQKQRLSGLLKSLRELGEGEDRAIFIKSTYHFAPFSVLLPRQEAGKSALGQWGPPKVQTSRKARQVHCPAAELPSPHPTCPEAHGPRGCRASSWLVLSGPAPITEGQLHQWRAAWWGGGCGPCAWALALLCSCPDWLPHPGSCRNWS